MPKISPVAFIEIKCHQPKTDMETLFRPFNEMISKWPRCWHADMEGSKILFEFSTPNRSPSLRATA